MNTDPDHTTIPYPHMHTRIKICCISSLQDAFTAVEAGANAIGLVGRMPSGPGVIGDELIAQIARTIPAGTETFLLTSERTAPGIIAHHQRTQTAVIQLVDSVPKETLATLRATLSDVKLVQVIHVLGRSSVDAAIEVAPHVDALLLDSGRPDLPVKELGGTGRTHDWSLSKEICRRVEVPVYLAGGLRPENVRQAIDEVQPFGVDVCSGVRTDGKLDPAKLQAFIHEVQSLAR